MAHVGTRIDDWRDEEPGKMLHQAGHSPQPDMGDDPFDAYYGDYATPVDFVAMLGQYYAWTNDLQTSLELVPTAKKALGWLERYADLDGDGLIEYRKRSPKGVLNQGWKDSKPSIVDEHGTVMTEDPMVTCELEGSYYAALRSITPLLVATGDRVHAATAAARQGPAQHDQPKAVAGAGGRLRAGPRPRGPGAKRGHQQRQPPAHHRDPDIAAGPTHRSTADVADDVLRLGHPDPDHGESRLPPLQLPPEQRVGGRAGHDRGRLRPIRLIDESHQLARSFFDLAALFDDHRIPESVGGIARDAAHPHPGIYPKADSPQAWSASGVVMMVQALLGLRPMTPLGVVALDPFLPEWLPELSLRNVRLGHHFGELHFWRDKRDKTHFRAETPGVCVVRVKGLREHRLTR